MTENQQKRLDALKEYKRKGYTMGQIKNETGWCYKVIKKYNQLYNLNIPAGKRGPHTNRYNNGEFILYCNTHTMPEIRQKYGNVYWSIRRYNIDYIKQKHRSGLAIDIINDLKEGKICQADIARKYGVSRQYVFILKNKEQL